MTRWLAAVQFLTLLPVRPGREVAPADMAPFFPLAGLVIGTVLAAVDAVAVRLWPAPAAAAVDLLCLVAVTGALHLDGLADTADGLYGFRTKERALEIMKDSRVGAMGLSAVVCSVLAKWAGLASLGGDRLPLLLAIPALSRSAMLFGFKLLPYGRQTGTGKAFFDHPLTWRGFWGLAVAALVLAPAGRRALVVLAAFVAATTGILIWYQRKIGCITGDMLGAMTEVTETAMFLAAGAAWPA